MVKWILGALAAIVLAGGAYGLWFWKHGTLTMYGLTGPALGQGNSTESPQDFDLAQQIPGFEGYRMRGRYIVVKPGGIIRIHDHHGRPAFSYMVNVPVDQHRSDRQDVIHHRQGDVSADVNMAHWWRNTSNQTAIWYVVDIYHATGNKGE